MNLTFVVPAYNEEKIIAQTLEEVLAYLRGKKYSWEVVVVDDGSRDRTSEIVRRFEGRGVKLITLPLNQGKGAAIRAGVMISKGEFVLFSDADLSVPMRFVEIFLERIEKQADVVIGSRRVRDSNIIKHQQPIRELLGRVFTLLSKVVTFTNVTDFTCGFKGFKRRAAMKIFPKTVVNRWVYDSEIIFLARKFKYKIVEVPVDWSNRKDSRVSLGSAVFTSFIDLLKIRVNDLLGKYE